jgi:hypothetical protein
VKDSERLSDILVDLLVGALRNGVSFCSFNAPFRIKIQNRKKLYEAKILIVDAPSSTSAPLSFFSTIALVLLLHR